MLIAATESVVVAMFTWMSVVEALPNFGGSNETAIEPLFGAANAPCASTRLARTVAAASTFFIFVTSFRPETVGGNLRSRNQNLWNRDRPAEDVPVPVQVLDEV